ncbi:hypothetical protein FEP63_00001 [Burkholderia multivorans]|nr:hypothetical protein [Burkholderia multivorans]MDR8883435.1 hypothetical protein [Burkholderia multivorans]MDR8884369.1 hypothetical protein [Burkholderia multivorans]MDR8890937.1 hypothetical protein [Burkholderia multivorans]MDR8901822.1 hypothetical protein [Burkholderia multivorans]
MSRRHTHRSAFCDSIDHAMPIFTTKSAPRQIVRLALTIEIHSDPSRSEADLSTWINGSSMMTCEHLTLGLLAVRPSTRCPPPEQNQCLGESSTSRSPSKFTAIRVAPRPTIHMDKRQLVDDLRALNARSPCGSAVHAMPTSGTKSVPRRIDRLALTVEVHSDRSVCAAHISTSRTALRWIVSRPSPNSVATIRAFSHPTSAHRKPCLDDVVALAHRRNAQRSECPCRRHIHIGCAATENRPSTTHRSNSQQAESPRGSHAHVKAAHKRKASCS